MHKAARLKVLGLSLICLGVCASLAAYLWMDYKDAESFYMVSLVLGGMAVACFVLK